MKRNILLYFSTFILFFFSGCKEDFLEVEALYTPATWNLPEEVIYEKIQNKVCYYDGTLDIEDVFYHVFCYAPGAEEWFSLIGDTNRDGHMSFEEKVDFDKKRVEMFDLDKDGDWSIEELIRYEETNRYFCHFIIAISCEDYLENGGEPLYEGKRIILDFNASNICAIAPMRESNHLRYITGKLRKTDLVRIVEQ